MSSVDGAASCRVELLRDVALERVHTERWRCDAALKRRGAAKHRNHAREEAIEHQELAPAAEIRTCLGGRPKSLLKRLLERFR